MKTKTFDCVEMKRRGAALIYEKIKDMTMAEELAFWKQREAAMRREVAPRKRRRARPSPVRSRKPTA